MEVETPTNELSQTQYHYQQQQQVMAAAAKAKTKAKAKASITDTVELILWLKTEQARITREVKQLNAQGYQTTALYNYWHILENQIKALEFELILEKSAELAIE
ncbi:hypothetical protein EC957_008768 [Mortierella hygrophila]|uniref:Uncharacterized protein n=1 Tax=Mortierella hygrophila TaxID=979708 RepID=A0A9P6JY38_9FUNG|nr:hypothetical protein EC957_008768 [Mortierella hygrophila]